MINSRTSRHVVARSGCELRSIRNCRVPPQPLSRQAMTQQLAIDQARRDRRGGASSGPLQEITIYSHSTLLYWWPAWAFGFVAALLNAGRTVPGYR